MSAAQVPRRLSTVCSTVVSTLGIWDRTSVDLGCCGLVIMQSNAYKYY